MADSCCEKALLRLFSFILIISISRLKPCFCMEQDFTITIEPGKQECFFQSVVAGQVIDVEYQVIDGGHGNLDITFSLFSPQGLFLAGDVKKTDAAHRHEAKYTGDYKVCFDNTFSRFSSKIVFFELIVESEGENGDDDDDDDTTTPRDHIGGASMEEIYDMKIEDIQDIIEAVKNRLNKVRHIQDQLRTFEARDRNLQEHNFARVNNWSMLQLTVMIVVGVIQVVMLRSLFDDRSRVHKIWKLAAKH